MKLEDIRAAEAQLLVKTYDRTPICFVRGEGVHLFDENGTAYLDLLSGIGVCALGYGHPAIQAAIDQQSRKLMHTSNLFFHPGQAELALRLTEMTGLDRVFFCNSGTEAWEAALKLAAARRMRDAPRLVPVRTQSCAPALRQARGRSRSTKKKTGEWGNAILLRALMPCAILSLYEDN